MVKKIELSDNALEVAESRYFMEGEDWETCTHRVAKTIAEPEVMKIKYAEKFHEILYNMDFIAGGRIMRNSGRAKGSLFNCYVLPIGDSIEEIGQFKKEALILWSMGGGVGCNWSALRPKNDPILGKGGHSSGLVSFLESADFDAKQIESGGSRRAAALACVEVTHPEVLDFIDAKIVHGTLSHHNISVGITNQFLEAVELDKDWEFKFKQRTYGKEKARFIWNKIVKNMLNHAEPGLLNFSNLFKNNSYYYDPVVSTNPCGEAVLSPHDICCLGSLVLPSFITNVNTNWIKLENTIKLAIRFLDNVIEMNKYVLKENDIKAHNSRRIGLGVLGLAEYLFSKGLRYGSEKALAEVDRLVKFVKECAYQASIELAVEKGAFTKFEPVPYSKASFVRKLPLSMRMDIKEKGIRNVTCLSFAPTGTISLLTDYTSGIEPLFSKAYERKDRVSKREYIHPRYMELLKSGEEIPEWFVDSFDIQPKDHFEMQQTVQKHVDAAVSKTINLPHDTTINDLDSLLLESVKDLKGVTVYRDGCREGQPLTVMSEDKVKQHLNLNKKVDNSFKMEDVQCATGSCEI
jgi:ribonucleoside-diphosphate reductase alpha chain